MKIFISYSNTQKKEARNLVTALREKAIDANFAEGQIRPGQSIFDWINNEIETADHCIVLWSKEASQRGWVQAEMEAAFVRGLEKHETFLIFARLDDHPLPPLCRPRLSIDIGGPSFFSGLDTLVRMISEDTKAAAETGYSVRPGLSPNAANDEVGVTIYLCSELWQLTMPIVVTLTQPVAVFIRRLVETYKLPSRVPPDGPLGIRIRYELATIGGRLSTGLSLVDQAVAENSLLYLETVMELVADVAPVPGSDRSVYRGGTVSSTAISLRKEATRFLQSMNPSQRG